MPTNGVETLSQSASTIHVPSAMPPFSVSDIRKRTHAIQEVMKGVMKEGTHFGTIPGTPKPSLWKAGAEVLCMTFRLAPILESRVTTDNPEAEWAYTGTRRDGNIVTGTCIGFFEVESICTITGMNGETFSRCSARCCSREAKYRSLALYDIRNTIQKMAEKRAFVSAVLMATGASDIFTQDIEDFPELVGVPVIQSVPAQKVVEVQNGQPVSSESEVLKPTHKPGTKAGQWLTPKREAWLQRVAQEGQVGQDVVQRCMAFLKGTAPERVGQFFDELARKRGEAFSAFKAIG